MPDSPNTFRAFLRNQYDKIFSGPWPVIPSALVVASMNVFLFAFDRPWTASDGVRNWGDWLLQSTGIVNQPDLLPPWLYSGSVLNIGVLAGGLLASLLSREFAFRPAPVPELAKGALGGLLMGWGAMLSFGCNIGGFFSALSALSMSGLAMMAGLGLGAFLGTRYLIRERAKLIRAGQPSFASACDPPPGTASPSGLGVQPLCGFFVSLILLGVGYAYSRFGYTPLIVFLAFGVMFGVLFQRSRFCLVRAFREPFMSGEAEHTRAAAVALTLSVVGFSILKAADLKDASEWVFPSFWHGAFVGGAFFGFGMVIAGGCGAGSIWRAGEGHIKLWAAVFCFAIGAAMMRLLLVQTEWIRNLGSALFLPNLVGWTGSVGGVITLMILWYLLCGWNEQCKQASALKV